LVVGGGVLISSCAQQRDPRAFTDVPAEIEEYYSRFESYYGVDPSYVSAGFIDKIEGEESIVAVCKSWTSGHREILIEKGYWNQLNDYGREELVFHELGHCVFNRGHDNSTYQDGCPASIMNEYVFGESQCYIDYRDDLITELGE
jgi:hypothetical protein